MYTSSRNIWSKILSSQQRGAAAARRWTSKPRKMYGCAGAGRPKVKGTSQSRGAQVLAAGAVWKDGGRAG